MYCVKCGVELADSEINCPLCKTKVVCPEGMTRPEAASPFPQHHGKVTEGITRSGFMFILTFFFLVPLVICIICDYNLNNSFDWSGYVVGGMGYVYVSFALPCWFRKPNPVIFVPVSFLSALMYLLFICLNTGGKWFLSLAFPITLYICIVFSAVVTLLRYVKGGRLFIYGGMVMLLGILTVLIELFLHITFDMKMFRWSLYPLIGLSLVGLMLIIIGICRPLRESLRRKLFF